MVDRARLESGSTFTGTGSSNLPLSASHQGPDSIDDQQIVVNTLSTILETVGYTVVTSRSGQDALCVCREHDGPIHAALLDVVVPGIEAPELRDSLQHRFPAIRLLYVSGYTPELRLRYGIHAEWWAVGQRTFKPLRLPVPRPEATPEPSSWMLASASFAWVARGSPERSRLKTRGATSGYPG